MNDGSGGCGGLVWWWRRRAGVLAIVAGLAVLMAACSSPSPRPSPGAYMACMRKHGVTGAFASPPGMSMPTSLPAPGSGTTVKIPAKESAALQACQSLAPPPGRGPGPGRPAHR